MMCAGAYITCPGGGGDITGLPANVPVPDNLRVGVSVGPEQVRSNVRRIFDAGADMIKVIATGAVLTSGTNPGEPELTEDEIRAAVEEAEARGSHVAAHAHGAEGANRAIRAGVRSIEHGCLIDDETIELMVERGTYLVCDMFDGDWMIQEGPRLGYSDEVMGKTEMTNDAQRENFAKAVKAGVKDRVRHGLRDLPARDERQEPRVPRAVRADADRGDPERDADLRRSSSGGTIAWGRSDRDATPT